MSSNAFTDPWWEATSERKVLTTARAMYESYLSADKNRMSAYNAYYRLYTNREIHGNDYISAYTAAYHKSGGYSRVPLNVIKIIADAAHARVTRQPISVKFLTEGGDPSNQKGARQMENYVEHKEQSEGVGEIAEYGYLDAEICGTGVVRSSPHLRADQIETTRVRAADVFVDPAVAATTEKPCDLYQRSYVPRTRLKALFPEYEKQIKKAGVISQDPYPVKYFDRPSVVEVVEGWKLPSWPKAGDGKYVMFIDGQLLAQSDWELDDFPHQFTHWKKDPTVGFWGIGLGEELMGVHFNINNSLYHIHRSVEIMPKPIFFLPSGSEVSEGQIGNVHGLIVKFVDGQPRVELPMSVPNDVANLVQMEWGHALEIGRLAALGLPESTGGGFETGQALRDFNDIQSTELAPNFKGWQNFREGVSLGLVTSGKMIADRAKEAGREYKVVLAKDKNTIEEIDWENIELDPLQDSYVIRALPSSSLSQTFAGKKADVIDMLNAQLIDQGTALALLDFNDTDVFFSQLEASRRLILETIEVMLDTGEFIPFDPNEDLRLGLKLYQQEISRARLRKVPEDRIALLEDAKQQILKFIEEEQQTTRNAAVGIGGGLPGSPAALDMNGMSPQAVGPEGQQ